MILREKCVGIFGIGVTVGTSGVTGEELVIWQGAALTSASLFSVQCPCSKSAWLTAGTTSSTRTLIADTIDC